MFGMSHACLECFPPPVYATQLMYDDLHDSSMHLHACCNMMVAFVSCIALHAWLNDVVLVTSV